ncbi:MULTISPECIES: NAD(P)-dependent alcohol dehydrogenase [unclassified Pseudonocardia]|uniref:NAD(P)-dependent alcohol dehydrogenase n=1 Tax=unclassified Pseudonocardia TaxID=2619320 RepID=UPI0004924438|nr:NAD(P)-dependent alcohol dehydrogenase [Pseudonocardia sp. Ae707_Ps1]OLM09029.1 alcohol dehydrogenase [Pseudonocardia sp. Ae707_Ps1]
MQIEAAVLRSYDRPFVLEQVELPEPGPGQVVVEIAGTGFCHTDVLPRTPGFMAAPPLIAGHEGAGVVTAIGEHAAVPVGTPVLLSYDSCATCETCLDGHPAYCRQFFRLNMTGRGAKGSPIVRDRGGEAVASRWFGQSSFATHVLAGPRNVVPVAEDLPLHLFGPLGCGIQTGAGSVLIALGVRAGSGVVVYGAGAVGLAAVMAARVAGATTIVAVDLHDARLETALELGATHVVRGNSDTLVEQVVAVTGGGAHYALDTTAVPRIISAGIDGLRPTGTIGLVGAGDQDLVLASSALAAGKNIMGILEGDAVPQLFLPRLIELWRQGRFPFDRLVTTYPLAEIDRAEHDAASGATIKPVLIPGKD